MSHRGGLTACVGGQLENSCTETWGFYLIWDGSCIYRTMTVGQLGNSFYLQHRLISNKKDLIYNLCILGSKFWSLSEYLACGIGGMFVSVGDHENIT